MERGYFFADEASENYLPAQINTRKIKNKTSEAGLHQKCLHVFFPLYYSKR